jgi:hypothetical protein
MWIDPWWKRSGSIQHIILPVLAFRRGSAAKDLDYAQPGFFPAVRMTVV